MAKKLTTVLALLLCADTAWANAGPGPEILTITLFSFPCMIAFFSWVSGSYAILEAREARLRGWREAALLMAVPILGMLFFPYYRLVCGLLCLYAVYRGLSMALWAFRSRKPQEQREPSLVSARPVRLVLSSLALLFFSILALLFAFAMKDGQENSVSAIDRGNLGAIRSALSIYYGDMEGQYPDDMNSLTVNGKYMRAIPTTRTAGLHPASASIRYGKVPDDSGGWVYNNDAGDPNFGTVFVNCTHTDAKGRTWTSY